jgi:hypothetical protein
MSCLSGLTENKALAAALKPLHPAKASLDRRNISFGQRSQNHPNRSTLTGI